MSRLTGSDGREPAFAIPSAKATVVREGYGWQCRGRGAWSVALLR
ncbi:MAG: hypothetical protein R6W81_06355 [Bacteroidales bacterium]